MPLPDFRCNRNAGTSIASLSFAVCSLMLLCSSTMLYETYDGVPLLSENYM